MDSDTEEGEFDLTSVWERALSLGYEMYFEPSRRGGHLWMFTEPIAGSALRQVGSYLIGDKKIEIYPKQTTLESDDFGSLVRLPLGIHRKSGQRYPIEWLGLATRVGRGAAYRLAGLSARAPAPRVPLPSRDLRESVELDPAFVFDFIDRNITRLSFKGKGSCPLHPPDRGHSFSVDREKGVWCCFHETKANGRFLGGDLYALIMRLEGISFPEALKKVGA